MRNVMVKSENWTFKIKYDPWNNSLQAISTLIWTLFISIKCLQFNSEKKCFIPAKNSILQVNAYNAFEKFGVRKMFLEQQIRMISEGSCDTKDWSNALQSQE